ncbi:MAG: hypothetical protein ACQEV0_13525 [Bacillota bacterium]
MDMKRLYLDDLEEIERVQKKVLDSLSEKNTLQPLSTEEFLFILNNHGLIVGAFVEEELVAFRALLVPEIDDEHLGRDIGLAEHELGDVIYQEISAVIPDYRGNRLQQKLAEVVMKELGKLEKKFRYVACTVAPMNIPSLKDKFTQHMHIAAMKTKYEGLERYILVKDLEHPHTDYGNHVTVRIDDLQKQKELLNEGYVGIGFQMVKGFHALQFAKPLS